MGEKPDNLSGLSFAYYVGIDMGMGDVMQVQVIPLNRVEYVYCAVVEEFAKYGLVNGD